MLKKCISLLMALIFIISLSGNAFAQPYAFPDDEIVLPQYVVASAVSSVAAIEGDTIVGSAFVMVRQSCKIVFDLDIQESSNNSSWSICHNGSPVTITTGTTYTEVCEFDEPQSRHYYRLKANIKIYVNNVLKDSIIKYSDSVYYS